MAALQDLSGRTVYVITSEAETQRFVRSILESVAIHPQIFQTAEELLSRIDGNSTGCIITDMTLPRMNAEDLIRHLATRNLPLPVIVLSHSAELSLVVRLMKLGADNFLQKPANQAALIAAVREAVIPTPAGLTTDIDSARVTPRERQVLELLCAGKPTKRIARELALSAKSVEHYRAHLMQKFNAANVAELVYRAALKNGK